MKGQRAVAPPEDFDEASRSLWQRVQGHLREQETWGDTDAELLEAYVRAVATFRAARRGSASEPFVDGSKGQLVAHPGLKVAAGAEGVAHRFASSLLLTPEARKRYEVKHPGSSNADGLRFLRPAA